MIIPIKLIPQGVIPRDPNLTFIMKRAAPEAEPVVVQAAPTPPAAACPYCWKWATDVVNEGSFYTVTILPFFDGTNDTDFGDFGVADVVWNFVSIDAGAGSLVEITDPVPVSDDPLDGWTFTVTPSTPGDFVEATVTYWSKWGDRYFCAPLVVTVSAGA